MSLLSLIPSIIGGVLKPVFGIVDKFVEDKDLAAKLKAELKLKMATMNHDELTKTLESQTQIILAEAKGGWLQRNWRPLLMLVCILIIANNFIIFPYASLFTTKVVMLVLPDWLWKLMMLGVGGYVGGRSFEKIATTLKDKLPWGKNE